MFYIFDRIDLETFKLVDWKFNLTWMKMTLTRNLLLFKGNWFEFVAPLEWNTGLIWWRYKASTNLYVWQWLLPTTSLNFTFRCKNWKCPISKIRDIQKATITFLNVFYISLKVFYIFILVQSACPVATLLNNFYLNQALLSAATGGAGRCAGSLFPEKM